MKVGLIGFGKTGRSVASVILDNSDVSLEWVVRRSTRLEHRSVPEFLGADSDEPGLIYSSHEFTAGQLLERHPVDAIIDFSSPQGVDYYAAAAAERGVAIVCAVSKFDSDMSERFAGWARSTALLWSPNITIGINFMLLAAKTLQMIAPCADIEIVEEHFKHKAEVSGTAVRLAAGLGQDPAAIKTIRAGGIIGTHEVLFGFPFQTVRLRHESISREAFGDGALFAAQHLVGRPNGVYRMEDLLLPYFTHAEGNCLDAGLPATTRRHAFTRD